MKILFSGLFYCQWPNHAEHTRSRPARRRASSVLRWETAWEPEVLLAYFLLLRQKKEITKCSCRYVLYQHIILLPTLASK